MSERDTTGCPSLISALRERVALWLAPWLYVPYRDAREEAFRDLAEVAYGSRDAVWTSPGTLVRTALREYGQHTRRIPTPDFMLWTRPEDES